MKTQPSRIAEKEEVEPRQSVDIDAVTRALGLSFIARASGRGTNASSGASGIGVQRGTIASSSSSSSSESESDSGDSESEEGEGKKNDEEEEDAEAKRKRKEAKALEKKKTKDREKLMKKFVRKLKSRGDVDASASIGGTSAASAAAAGSGRGGSSFGGFPSLASSAVLKFKNLPSARRMRMPLHNHSDPCLMGESQSLSSDDEGDDEKPTNYGSVRNDANLKKRVTVMDPAATEIAEIGDVSFDGELEIVLSPSAAARVLQAQSSLEATGLERLTDLDKPHVQRTRSTSDTVAVLQQQHHQQRQSQGLRWGGLRKEAMRAYGKINNSYFAHWLVMCSIAVIALDIMAVVIVQQAFDSSHDAHGNRIALRQHRSMLVVEEEEKHEDSCDWRLKLLRGMHYVGIPNILLVAPVLFSSECFALYKSKHNRIVRRPYLQVCELIITLQMAFMIYFAADQVYNLPETLHCHEKYTASEIAMLYSSLVMWVVLMRQIIVFCRFIAHQKLQADGANDANHTSEMSSWLKRYVLTQCLSVCVLIVHRDLTNKLSCWLCCSTHM